jgi:hypothetical protein
MAQAAETLPAIAGSSASLVQMVERIAFNPDLPIDRLKEVFDFYKMVKAEEAKAQYTAAMSAMQPVLPSIDANGKIIHNNKVISQYAKWEDVNDVIKPILAAHGFSLDFDAVQDEKSLTITANVEHTGGHTKRATLRLPIDTSGAKNAVQSIGSTVSYGKRYTAGLTLNLTSRAPGESDDDGRAAGAGRLITDLQVEHIRELIVETGADLTAFLEHFKIGQLSELPATAHARAIALLERKAQKAAK